VSQPRRHHLVPVFYLTGFTPTLRSKGRLQVFDYHTGKRYKTSPTKACRETDFFRLEYPGEDPQSMEKVMAEFERKVARHTQAIARDQRAASKDQISEVLALAALLAARSRRGRRQLETVLAPKIARALRDRRVTEEEWERHRQLEVANGAREDDVPAFADARERLIEGSWFPTAPRALVVGLIPEAQDSLLKQLRGRHWELHVTNAKDNGGFISSDSPLVWGDLHEIVDGHDPSLREQDLEITFPVSKDVALVSYPEARDSNVTATEESVGRINIRTLQMSMGLVIHAHDDFLLQRRTGEIATGSAYFEYQADARRRGIINP
jgi:hypothetical protein